MIDLWTIPDPPPDVGVRLERADDAVEFSGAPVASDSSPGEQPATHNCSPGLLFARVFIRLWTLGVVVIFGFGVVFVLFGLGMILFADVSFKFNGKPVGTGAAVAITLAFLTGWIVLGTVMLLVGRRVRSMLAVASGQAAARQWRLIIERSRIDAIQEEMGATTGRRQCNPDDVRRIYVNSDGCLTAEVAVASGTTPSDMVLAGPLGQRDAEWLEDTLRRLLGLRGW